MPIAIETVAANEQHYELPPEFFVASLGPNLKYPLTTALTARNCDIEARYSSCLFTKEELCSPLVGNMDAVLQAKASLFVFPCNRAVKPPTYCLCRPLKSACFPSISSAPR